jgi:zinc-ribbon domain
LTDTSFCPNCGERISARSRFCPSCGARQDEFAVPVEEGPAPTFPTEAVIGAVPPPGDPATAGEKTARDDAEFVEPAPTFPTEAVIRAVPSRAEPEPDLQYTPGSEASRTVKPHPPLPERIGSVDPHAGELSGLLEERLALPGIVAAVIAGSAAAGVVLLAGLLIALVTPDSSIIGAAGVDASVVVETFRQALGTLLAPMVDPGTALLAGSRRIHPMILLAIPLTALALTTRWQIHRTEGAPPLARLMWALLVAVPFGLLMLLFAVIGGETESTSISPPVGNAFALGLLWGVIGGAIGAATTLPLGEAVTVPPAARRAATAVTATLRPLAAVVLTCTAIALVGWLVQVGANAGDVRGGRSAPTALIEETVYLGEHGVHLTALAAGVLFRPDAATTALGLPFPVDDPNEIQGADGAFRIFGYADALPAYVFLPMLVILLCLVALGALYAGLAAARAVGADSPPLAAAWGAITGPAWAVVMAAAVVLAGGLLHGDAGDGSVFGIFLLGGAALGAAGGALSASGARSRPAENT